MEWARERDTQQKIEFVPCQSAERRERFPQITEDDCLKAMYVVFPDGRFFAGADAAPHLLHLLPNWKWCVTLLSIPGIVQIARPVYRLIARNRHHLHGASPSCKL